MQIKPVVWPPTRTRGVTLCWSLLAGLFLQWCVPAAFKFIGCNDCGLIAILPGALPILWLDTGWLFKGFSSSENLLARFLNTLVYAGLTFTLLKIHKLLSKKSAPGCPDEVK